MTAHAVRRPVPVPTIVEEYEPGFAAPERRSAAQQDAPAESIEWLIDNADAYARLLGALRGARRSVRIAQLALDPDCVAYERADGPDGAPPPCPTGDILAEALLAVAERGEVEISVLLNATLLLDTRKPLARFLAAAGARGIQVRGGGRFPWLLHVKMVIIDGAEAFLIGSPFVNGYWDDPHHRPVDARRPHRELGGRPLHDVSLRVSGPVVGDLDAMFCALWNDAARGPADRAGTLAPYRSASPTALPARRGALRLARTLSPDALTSAPHGATEILDACLDGIGRARSLIYVEHQYLSSRPIVFALAAALRREPALEIIAVVNQNPDITAYRAWQAARLADWDLLAHPRVGIFALWSTAPRSDTGRLAINQVFVHSKVLTIDDRWATSGSANLDGVSLHSYGDDFEGWLGRRIFRGVRSVEANIVVDDRGDASWARATVTDLRQRLWREHLGVTEDVVRAEPPSGGWLALWRRCAEDNVASLNAGPAAATMARRMRGFVLPFSPSPTPPAQLADIGVDVSAAALDLCFNPGWLEVNFSPNWVRNMFS